jgi:hypothetical protein
MAEWCLDSNQGRDEKLRLRQVETLVTWRGNTHIAQAPHPQHFLPSNSSKPLAITGDAAT